jgi:CHASE3 domain sensor protein
MKFEEFLKAVTPKISPEAAFNLSRDLRLKALEELLMRKIDVTREEIEKEQEKQFAEMAQIIQDLPPLPTDKKS